MSESTCEHCNHTTSPIANSPMAEGMTDYRLRITKLEPNPNHDPKRPTSMYNPPVEPVLEVESLTVTITEAQFQAIRKAVLEQF